MRRIGRYEVVSELGRGGMGAVFKAWDPQDRTHVAVKLLLQASDPRQLSRFRREAQVMQRLQHPNVVPVRGYGEDGGRPYLVMDLVAGEPLDQRIEARGPLSPSLTAEIGRSLASALAAGHAQGILHRDVKPSNVLLRTDGEVLLTDFGLAKDVNLDATQLTVEGGFMGTLGFAAPEQAQGRAELMGPPCDVYGLGATLYYTLSGRPPFEGRSMIEIVDAQQRPPVSLRSLRPEIPQELAALVACCLEPELSARYRSCELVERDLRVFLSGERPGAPADPTPSRVPLGLALVLVAGLGVWGGWTLATGDGAAAEEVAEAPRAKPPLESPPAKPPLEALLARAATAFERQEWETARLVFERVLQRDPEHVDALHGLWRTLRELGDPAEREVLERAFAANPHPDLCLALAEANLVAEDEPAALAVLRVGHSATPDDPRLNRKLGALYTALDQPQEALPYLQRAWELQPTYAQAVNLASGLHQLGRNAEALPLARRATAENPDSLQSWFLLGMILTHLEDYRAARAPFAEVWERSGGNYPLAVRPYARSLRESGLPQEAVAVLSRGLADAPDNVDWLLSRALSYSALGKAEEELADLDAALKLQPDETTALRNRSVARFALEDYEGALADAEHLQALEPDSLTAWVQIGACHYALGAWEPAAAAYGQAIELSPDSALYCIGRAQALAELGRLEEAVADFTAALERDPGQQSARWQLGKALDELGETERALEQMRVMLKRSEEGSRDHSVASHWIERLSKKLAEQEPPGD